MKIVESGVGFTEEIVGRICSGAITAASAIVPGFSKNWEWNIDDLGPLVPEWSTTGSTKDIVAPGEAPAAFA